ncbi:glycosyltransferase family 2 protein [Marixanthomonas sp. SCSIO 43207]|uniref:glycosyltransferase n=1 Tax=Marixanthomonas sp. SCSIO 43207 TaxID=2779360 RepID=UPI001CA9A7B5|nr:glycosyltransferase family 2 protein [Marixanthomonas sp. SCSIO 43207]UAB81227.1 glycosyltransferase family 2 protein [Marixanthomonas sp. SCSIO 43207]
MDTAIIIVTYNGMPWIAKCLASCVGYKIYIVDNASIDGTPAYIQKHFNSATLIKSNKNLGFGKANNIGITRALKEGFKNVFLLNQDAYIVGNSILTLEKTHNSNTEFGILSPIHLNGLGTKLDKRFAKLVAYDKNKNFYSDYVLNNQKSAIYEIPFVNAAGWYVSGDCLKNVGGFDPLFFHYGEDDNYCQRVRFHNYKIGVVPGTFIKHDREDRLAKQPKNSDKTFFDTIERRLKKKYADPNENFNLHSLLKKRKQEAFRAMFKLDRKKRRVKFQEIQIIEKLIPKINFSKLKAMEKAAHYLNLDEYDK